MNRSIALRRGVRTPITRVWLLATLALLLAVGCGLLLAQLLIAPPASDIRVLAASLTLSGAATIGGGWLIMRAIDHTIALSLRAKSVFTALTGTAVALLNVLIVAQLMFVSTSHDLRLLIALIVFSAMVTAGFSAWAASLTASRLEAIAVALRSLAAGQYATRASVIGRDEVASVAADINVLAARLETVEAERAAVDAERRELTAAISHDLRTPLASLRAMVEALDDGVVDDPKEVRRYYATMRREIDRLSRMIGDLFELAQIDAGALRLDVQELSMRELVSEVVDAMQPQARQRGIALGARITEAATPVSVDGTRIERAIANVVRNALEHTPAGGNVSVDVRAEPTAMLVSVTDTGEGIAPQDLEQIWQRFYRASKSRTRRDDEGAGLGLAIVRGIIESHGGSVEAESQVGTGTTVHLRLPIHIPQSPPPRERGTERAAAR